GDEIDQNAARLGIVQRLGHGKRGRIFHHAASVPRRKLQVRDDAVKRILRIELAIGAPPESFVGSGVFERLLLVRRRFALLDDDSTVVQALKTILRRSGYEVLAAETLEEAIAAARVVSELDLLVVDAVMPKMSGPELAEILLFLRPKMKILFITGLDCLTIRL